MNAVLFSTIVVISLAFGVKKHYVPLRPDV
jgi:hypothetical protein